MISSLDREARFSIIGFNYESSPWRTRLVKASPYNVEEARGFISRLSAGGGTNMHAALIDAVELCNSERDSPNVPCLILFMTDGTPTVGVTEEPRIHTDVTKARAQGEAEIAINIIGFGAGISHSFLLRGFKYYELLTYCVDFVLNMRVFTSDSLPPEPGGILECLTD